MHKHDIALVIAGVIGSGSAVVHGGPHSTAHYEASPGPRGGTDRHGGAKTPRWPPAVQHLQLVRRGLALFAAAHVFEREARLATGLLVGSSYLYAAVASVWATRGRPHPGWLLYGTALGLITYGLSRPAS